MEIRQLILFSVATLTPVACTGVGTNCGKEEPVTVDASVTEMQVQELLSEESVSERDQITCEAACRKAFYAGLGSGGSLENVSSCSLDLEPTAGDAPEQTVGTVQCSGDEIFYCEGRRPLGHIAFAGRVRDLGEHFARCAHLEAASIVAFTQLAERLTGFGAPQNLVERCHHAAADEREHARQLTALAERLGASTPPALHEPRTPGLFEVALDNAVEGCVHETWAALRAEVVSRRAQDPEVRSIYKKIAEDEARHAQLAWDLHRWLCDQLDSAERDQVEAARRRSLEALPELAARQSEFTPSQLGIPTSRASADLATTFRDRLLAAA